MLRYLVLLAALVAATQSHAQLDCGTAVETRRVQLENAYRGGRIGADAYSGARVQIEESAAACRAGQAVQPAAPQIAVPAPTAPSQAPTQFTAPPPMLPSQTTPQGLHIPSVR